MKSLFIIQLQGGSRFKNNFFIITIRSLIALKGWVSTFSKGFVALICTYKLVITWKKTHCPNGISRELHHPNMLRFLRRVHKKYIFVSAPVAAYMGWWFLNTTPMTWGWQITITYCKVGSTSSIAKTCENIIQKIAPFLLARNDSNWLKINFKQMKKG